jgi:hypothetical protein
MRFESKKVVAYEISITWRLRRRLVWREGGHGCVAVTLCRTGCWWREKGCWRSGESWWGQGAEWALRAIWDRPGVFTAASGSQLGLADCLCVLVACSTIDAIGHSSGDELFKTAPVWWGPMGQTVQSGTLAVSFVVSVGVRVPLPWEG